MSEMDERKPPPHAPPLNEDPGRDKLLEYLPTGLTVLTTGLATIGGLTGGIARMLRNNPGLSLVTLLAASCAILAALLAQVWRRDLRTSRLLVVVSILLFVASVSLGSWLAVDTASARDRPSLSAKLSTTADGEWAIEGAAAASGLAARDSLQLFIYAIPESSAPRSKLFFVTAGPNAEGVASQNLSAPLPRDQVYRSIVVTAAVGDGHDGATQPRSKSPQA